MYRDDFEALRARLAAVEAALEAERKRREAAEAETRAARAGADELRLRLKRLAARPPTWIRRHGAAVLCVLAVLALAVLAWRSLEPAEEQPTAERADLSRESPGGEGYLVANTYPWARVHVDGRDTGLTTPIPPARKLVLCPGTHRVTFVVNNERFPSTVLIKTGQTSRILRRLPVAAID